MYGRPIILVKLNLLILGVNNVVSLLDVVGDVETHIFKFWDAEDVSNPLPVDTITNGESVLSFGWKWSLNCNSQKSSCYLLSNI